MAKGAVLHRLQSMPKAGTHHGSRHRNP
jgi:hypothetical protein